MTGGTSTLHLGPAEDAYERGLGGSDYFGRPLRKWEAFPVIPVLLNRLDEWYAQHVEKWTERARPATTLWFWNTEVGWATVHPLLVAVVGSTSRRSSGTRGSANIAGNVNGATIRRFPTVTEVCVFYRRTVGLPNGERRYDRLAVATQRVATEWDAVASGEPGMWREECGHAQISHSGLALVTTATRYDGPACGLCKQTRQSCRTPLLLS